MNFDEVNLTAGKAPAGDKLRAAAEIAAYSAS
jgi:hypothetical protein